MVFNVACALSKRFSLVCIVAPEKSRLAGLPKNARIETAAGIFVPSIPSETAGSSTENVLENMVSYVVSSAAADDIVVNISYDALPFIRLAELTSCRVFHYISSAIESSETIEIIKRQFISQPYSIACLSAAQAKYLGIDQVRIIPLGIDVSNYPFQLNSGHALCWAGRISREKSPRTAFQVARKLGMPLMLLGSIQDDELWNSCIQDYPDVRLDYTGYLSTIEMRQKISECSVFLMTTASNKQFLEAFGIVVIEALACGVPVVTRRGHGPAEIIENGVSGVFVDGDNWAGAVQHALRLERHQCRQRAIEHFSTTIFEKKLLQWIDYSPR